MRFPNSESRLLSVFLLFSLLLHGCAVLTRSQVREVEKFARASQGYSELPGALASSYGILIRNSKLLSVTRKEFGQVDGSGGLDTSGAIAALTTIQSAYKSETEFRAAGRQMDSALAVLKSYSNLLTCLVSENFTDALSESAESFGNSMDRATVSYNEKYRKGAPLEKIGGVIAMAVRSGGGLFIRIKQASILKKSLKEASPLVIALMDEIHQIVSKKLRPSLINYEKNYMGKEFKSVANNRKHVDIATALFVYKNIYRTRQSITLADQILKAAENYKSAHRELVKNTRTRKTLKGAIAQVEAFAREVNAGNSVKKGVSGG